MPRKGTTGDNLAYALAVMKSFIASTMKVRRYATLDAPIPIPLESESKLSGAWPRIEQLSNREWNTLRRTVDAIATSRLSSYSMRMASYAVRKQAPEFVHHGLMGLIVDNNTMDYREVLGAGCLLYDACLRLKVGPDDLFRGAARFATKERTALLIGYLESPHSTKYPEGDGLLATGHA